MTHDRKMPLTDLRKKCETNLRLLLKKDYYISKKDLENEIIIYQREI